MCQQGSLVQHCSLLKHIQLINKLHRTINLRQQPRLPDTHVHMHRTVEAYKPMSCSTNHLQLRAFGLQLHSQAAIALFPGTLAPKDDHALSLQKQCIEIRHNHARRVTQHQHRCILSNTLNQGEQQCCCSQDSCSNHTTCRCSCCCAACSTAAGGSRAVKVLLCSVAANVVW